MVAARWMSGLLGSLVIFSGLNITAAQALPAPPVLLTGLVSRDLIRIDVNEYGEEAFQQLIEHWEQSLEAEIQEGDLLGQIAALNFLGASYLELKDYQTALDYYQQALSLSQTLDSDFSEIGSLINIAQVYYDLEEKKVALNYFQQALPLARAANYYYSEVRILNGIAKIYADLDEKQQALDYYQQLLPLYEQWSLSTEWASFEKAGMLIDIGQIHYDLGEKETALNYYQQSLVLFEEVEGDRHPTEEIRDRTIQVRAMIEKIYAELAKDN